MLFVFYLATKGQPVPPCGNDYGTISDRNNIQNQMFNGTVQDVVNAIDQAKNTRGVSLGCPQTNYGPLNTATLTEPSLSAIENIWTVSYKPVIESYSIGCAEISRGMPRYGLAALYARISGNFSDLASLEKIGKMLEAQQYSTKYAPAPLIAPAGIFAYYNGVNGDPCKLSGVAGAGVASFCTLVPQYCITYNNGLFSGKSFAVNDHTLSGNTYTGDIGGAGYDQGWGVAFMIENAIQQNDTALKGLFRRSAILGGEWAITHPMVTNHNYTSKLIWALAQLYAWTGRNDFKTALIDKVDKNLKPGILTDWNNDGFVDGTAPSISFSNLVNAAKIPGRNWDAHNSQPWYQSMNAWAMLETYVALRDRGDSQLAAMYKPYVIIMMDNLANEVLNHGVISNNQTGWADYPHALLLAVWKLVKYENETHQNWTDAIWAIWNSGAFNTIGDRGINIPLYLIIKKNIPYTPLHIREPLTDVDEYNPNSVNIHVYPNPASTEVNFELNSSGYDISKVTICDIYGRVLISKTCLSNEKLINLDIKLSDGIYFTKVTVGGNEVVKRLIVNQQ